MVKGYFSVSLIHSPGPLPGVIHSPVLGFKEPSNARAHTPEEAVQLATLGVATLTEKERSSSSQEYFVIGISISSLCPAI